jgi:hypothetical protein
MSNMLEQAIIDAESLKEAARQSAEEKIVEHFSKDIKEAINIILEQEEAFGGDPMAMGGDLETMTPTDAALPDDAAPTGSPVVDATANKDTSGNGKFVVDQLPYATTTDSKTFVSIDLDRLEESIRQELEENDMDTEHLEEEYEIDSLEEELLDEEFMLEDEEVVEEGKMAALRKAAEKMIGKNKKGKKDEEEVIEEETNQDLVEAIKSILAEDMEEILFEEEPTTDDDDDDDDDDDSDEAEDSTITESAEDMFEAYQAYEESLQLQQEGKNLKTKNKSLITEQNKLNGKVQLLEERLQKYGTVIEKLQEKLNETNLANAKLLYQNRVLDSDSLNERQKDRIVETIMDAKTVEEAKIIYETLQSAVGANSFKRKPKSLNEVVTKRSSAFMPRKEEKRVDPLAARMKALAGIKE